LNKYALRRLYRRYAPVYDLLFGAALAPGRRALAECCRGPRILEVGVGTGLALHLYPRDALVVGLDLSCEMLLRARRRVQAQALRQVRLLCADAEQLPFASASFDCVTLPYVLSVTPQPQRLLAELRRVCVPDGRILILNHFAGSRHWRWAERWLRPLAAKLGFDAALDLDATLRCERWRIEAIRSVNPFDLSRLVCIRNGG